MQWKLFPQGLFLALLLSACSASPAAIFTWDGGGTDNNWSTPANWSTDVAPPNDGTATAIFRSGSGATYTVTFPGSGAGGGAPAVNYVTDQLRVGNNSVTFADPFVMGSLVPSTYAANNATTGEVGRGIIVGELGTDTAAVLTTQLSTFSGVAATIGDASSSSGTLNVSAGSFNVTGSSSTDFECIVGRTGTGTMNVTGGATANVSGAFGDSALAEYMGSTGIASVSGAGSNWMTNRNLFIGSSGNGTLTVSAGAQVGSLKAWIANNGTSTSTATVTGTGSTWTNGSDLFVGNSGSGTLNVLSAGQVSSVSGYLGYNAGASGNATVNGSGSKWMNTGFLYVGYSGSGTLNVTNAGFISDNYGYIASEPMSTGMVSLDGNNTSWGSTHDLYIGNSGNGTLNLTGGAHVTSVNGFLGFSPNSSGTVNLSGATSLWMNSNNVTVGGSGSGLLTVGSATTVFVGGTLSIGSLGTVKGSGLVSGNVQNGGTVAPGAMTPGMLPGILNISGSYTQTAAGKLQVELGGTTPGSDYDRLAVSGAVTLGGTLQVSLVNSFAPVLGDKFDILDWGSRTGGFSSKTLPVLSGSLGWGTSALYSAGVLSVIDTNYLPGDFDRNGQVSVADVATLEGALKNLSAYQAIPVSGAGSLTSTQLVSIGDLTGDGLANNADLQGLIVYLANGGAIAAAQAVPEPRSAYLVASALGLLALVQFKRSMRLFGSLSC